MHHLIADLQFGFQRASFPIIKLEKGHFLALPLPQQIILETASLIGPWKAYCSKLLESWLHDTSREEQLAPQRLSAVGLIECSTRAFVKRLRCFMLLVVRSFQCLKFVAVRQSKCLKLGSAKLIEYSTVFRKHNSHLGFIAIGQRV